MRAALRLSESDERRFWAKVALPDENGCMLWMASARTNGYGSFGIGGRAGSGFTAHRVALFISEGEPPQARMDAAHACRTRLCVAPNHLRWATRAENEKDKLRDGVSNRGERHGLAKLTASRVQEIRSRYSAGGITQADLAVEFGIAESTVGMITQRRAWGWVA